MKGAFAEDFDKTLSKIKWPSKEPNMLGNLGQEWIAGVEKLLDLQEPYVIRALSLQFFKADMFPFWSELRARENQDVKSDSPEDPLVLLPMEVMVKPLQLRFRYHFDGDRPTNRLDKVYPGSERVKFTITDDDHSLDTSSPTLLAC